MILDTTPYGIAQLGARDSGAFNDARSQRAANLFDKQGFWQATIVSAHAQYGIAEFLWFSTVAKKGLSCCLHMWKADRSLSNLGWPAGIACLVRRSADPPFQESLRPVP